MAATAGPISATALTSRISAAKKKAEDERREVEAGTRKASYSKKVPAGGGLYVVVNHRGPQSWLLSVQRYNKRRPFKLGTYNKAMPLKDAREAARAALTDIEQGVDPTAKRKANSGVPTFAQAAKLAHAEKVPTFKNKKHAAQWITTLKTYAFPLIGRTPVDKVTETDVRDIVMKIWLTKNETASRVRQRIKDVIVWAAANKYRERPLHMDIVNDSLPKPPKRKHHSAMPYVNVPAFMREIATLPHVSAAALRYLVLTAARSGEIRHAAWSEIDTDKAVWVVPAKRMKMEHEHRVPLSGGALAVLQKAKQWKHAHSDLIFPGRVPTRPMSDMTLTKALRDMELEGGPTAHGFRSSFKDWAAETTDTPDRVSEAALAHADDKKTRAAYQRGDLFDKRRVLMDMWCDYLLPTHEGGNVVKLKGLSTNGK